MRYELKRVVAFILSIMMVVTMMPVSAFADGNDGASSDPIKNRVILATPKDSGFYNMQLHVILPEIEQQAGINRNFPYGDLMVRPDESSLYGFSPVQVYSVPVNENPSNYFGNNIKNSGVIYRQYSTDYAYMKYSKPDEPNVMHSIDNPSSFQPEEGWTVHVYFNFQSSFIKFKYDFRYDNEFNKIKELNQSGVITPQTMDNYQHVDNWELLANSATDKPIWFGEHVEIDPWSGPYQSFFSQAGDKSPKSDVSLTYYKDSDFSLWFYALVDPQNNPKGDRWYNDPIIINADGSQTDFFYYLCYLGRKPLVYTVKYFVDDVQIGETEKYFPADQNTQVNPYNQVMVKNFPADHTKYYDVDGNLTTVWGEKTFRQGVEVNYSAWLGQYYRDIVKVKPGETYKMPDADIEYRIYTTAGRQNFTVTKIWDDEENKAGMRPAITLQAINDGKVYAEHTLTEEELQNETVTYTFKNLPKYTENGDLIVYTVAETGLVDGYTATISSDGTTITNKYTPVTEEKTLVKIWNDEGNHDGKRPTEVTFVVTGSDGKQYTKTFSGTGDTWTTTVYVHKYYAGNAVTFTVDEEAVAGYSKSIAKDGTLTITNTYAPEKDTLTVKKIWVDEDNHDGKRPANVKFTVTGSDGNTYDVTLSGQGNEWTDTVEVYALNGQGQAVTFTVDEEAVAGYSKNIAKDGTLTITNTAPIAEKDIDPITPEKLLLGTIITYDIIVRNTGDVVMENVKVTETEGNIIVDGEGYTHNGSVATIASIAAGTTVTVKAEHKVTAADVTAGTYTNKAKATYGGKEYPVEETVTIGKTLKYTVEYYYDNVKDETKTAIETAELGDVITEYEDKPEGYVFEKVEGTPLTIGTDEASNLIKVYYVKPDVAKTDVTGNEILKDLGTTVKFEITVKNTGSVVMENVTVKETTGNTIVNGEGYIVEDGVAKITSIAAGETVAVHAEHIITEADILAGEYTNNAVVTYLDKDYEVSETIIPEPQKPALLVEKSADKTEGLKVKDVVTYTVKVTNTGNVTIKTLSIDDTLVETAKLTKTELAPGEWDEITYTYTVTQSDIDAGKTIKNIATVTGKDPDGDPVDGTDDEDVDPEGKKPELKVEKTADKTEGLKVGDVVTYTVKVTNTGNVTIKTLSIDDTLVETAKLTKTELAPGESDKITYTYTVTQSDIDAGKTIKNIATVTGKDPDGDPVDGTDDEDVDPEGKKPELKVEKTADKTEGLKVNDVVTYTVKVTNIGNVTIKSLSIDDTLVETAKLTKTELAPGESDTITYTYTVTQSDIDAGKTIKNIATVTGKDPDGDPVEDKDDEDVDPEDKKPALKVEKTADKTEGLKVGDVVTYTVKVTNTGNVTIKSMSIDDTLVETAKLTRTELAPGESDTITYTYTVTQSDIDAGKTIKNIATVTGKDPDGDPVEDKDDEDVETPQAGHLTVTKEAAEKREYKLGEKITYTVKVVNDGNLTITDITVTDELTNNTWTVEKMVPGEEVSFTTDPYTVTLDDANAGHVLNVATAKGTSPDPDEPEVPVTPGEDDEKVAPARHDVIVDYIYEDGTPAAPTFTGTYTTGDGYRVVSPVIPGYTADIKVVEGVMGDVDVHVVVTYTGNEYKVTIHYVDVYGNPVANDFEAYLKYNDNYRVESPEIVGYTANTPVVTGVVPAHDVEVTVIYYRGGNLTVIDDFDTPMGISSGINLGECFE